MTETMTEAPTTFVVGQRYRVNTASAMGATIRQGATVQCVRQVGGSFRFQEVSDQDTPEGREWYFTEAYLDPLPATVTLAEAFEPVIITQEQYDQAIRERNEARAQTLAERQTHRSYVNNVATDMSTINEIWAEAAERNDLCGVYDTVVERSNGRCSVLFFDERTQSWSATRTVEVTVTLRVTQSGNAEGRNEPDEDDVEWNEVDSYEVHEAIRNLSRGSYEYEVDDDNTDDFEAEHSE
jgi:hypothetical protein